MNDARDTAADLEALEAAAAANERARYVLRLYITGPTPQSTRAIVNIRKICEEHLEGRYDLEVIDICQHPTLAEASKSSRHPRSSRSCRCRSGVSSATCPKRRRFSWDSIF